MTAARRLSLVHSDRIAPVIPLPRPDHTPDALAGLRLAVGSAVTRRGWMVRVNGHASTGPERAVLDAATHAGLVTWLPCGDGDHTAVTTPAGDAALPTRGPGGDAA